MIKPADIQVSAVFFCRELRSVKSAHLFHDGNGFSYVVNINYA